MGVGPIEAVPKALRKTGLTLEQMDTIELNEAGKWHWVPWAVLAFVLVFPTYLSYFLVPVGLKYLKTTVVAMYSYLILVVTTVVSLTLGQDRFSWTQAAAIAMICISVYFVEVAEAKK